MKPTHPLPLNHSWPLFESGLRLDLGRDFDVPVHPLISPELMGVRGLGRWSCDLSDNSLTWSNEVYDLFGFPRGTDVARAEAVRRYREESRCVMERLRAHAIRHRRGFTIDVEICPQPGHARWVRLVAAPVCEGDRVVALQGLKRDVTRDHVTAPKP